MYFISPAFAGPLFGDVFEEDHPVVNVTTHSPETKAPETHGTTLSHGTTEVNVTLPTTTAFPKPDRTVCKGHKEGEFVLDPHDSHIYYECTSNGFGYKFTCPHGLIFDVLKKACVFDPKGPTVRPPDHGGSKFDCKGKSDGFYPDEHDKNKFHECTGGYASDFSCPPTTVFDPVKKICDFPKMFA